VLESSKALGMASLVVRRWRLDHENEQFISITSTLYALPI
jgi:hypothetical protein